MSLFRSSIGPPAAASDEAIERFLARLGAELDPDPLFRRRLRSTVTNRFVAVREGLDATPRERGRAMGRVGRAVLYATFVLAASVTSVMAASQGAIPGDALYPIKQQIEALRVRAMPEDLHDELAAAALRQRISEMAALAERGDWERVTALAAVIHDGYLSLQDVPGIRADGNIAVLESLLEKLPAQARVAVQNVLEGMPGIGQGRAPADAGSNGGENNVGTNPNGETNSGGANNPGSPGGPPDFGGSSAGSGDSSDGGRRQGSGQNGPGDNGASDAAPGNAAEDAPGAGGGPQSDDLQGDPATELEPGG